MSVFEILYLALASGLFFAFFRGELKRREHRKLVEAQRAGEDEHQLIQDIIKVRSLAVTSSEGGNNKWPVGYRDGKCISCGAETWHRWRPSPEAGSHWRCSECGEVSLRHPPPKPRNPPSIKSFRYGGES